MKYALVVAAFVVLGGCTTISENTANNAERISALEARMDRLETDTKSIEESMRVKP